MSEYQYYEFAAVDRPLDGPQLDELRALSTRADIVREQLLVGQPPGRPADHERLTAERVRREAAAAERGRAAAALRERRLAALRAEGEAVWRRVAALVATKKPAEYERTVDLLVDLRDVCPAEEFRRSIGALPDEHRRKPSLMDRLDHAGL